MDKNEMMEWAKINTPELVKLFNRGLRTESEFYNSIRYYIADPAFEDERELHVM